MPYLSESSYQPPFIFRNGHLSTIYSAIIKKTKTPAYHRKKLELPDGDFLLVDSVIKSKDRAVILCHGLTGDSHSSFINLSAQYFLKKNYSVFAWNNRSCGGEMNRLPQLYHHGSIADLDAVVKYVITQGFKEVFLIGFSLGGAQILNYFGRGEIVQQVKAGAAISTPIQLKSSAQKMSNGLSRIYANQFLKNIKIKLLKKAERFPKLIPIEKVKGIKTFEDLAETFIVPIHGFLSLEDYFQKASPGNCLDKIKTPVLILNALDDPILGEAASPSQKANSNKFLYLETPKHGGHCAFPLRKNNHSYAEIRVLYFFGNY